jgi:uncharacterized protein
MRAYAIVRTTIAPKGTKMQLTQLVVKPYRQMLQAMAGWLAKAQAQLPMEEAEVLLSTRLAPDMFPLATQIRFTCIQAQEAVYRLQNAQFPPHMAQLRAEALSAGEQPGTFADANAWIESTIALLASVAPDAFDADAAKPLAHELPNGMIFDFASEEFVRDWSAGQFYFHLMITYAILRSNGVSLGKADYIPHMFTFLRPGTMPTG